MQKEDITLLIYLHRMQHYCDKKIAKIVFFYNMDYEI